MKTYSIENSEGTVLRPNSEFERIIIFQYYLDNDIKINSKEKEILLKTVVSNLKTKYYEKYNFNFIDFYQCYFL
jgi:hypothetical protein